MSEARDSLAEFLASIDRTDERARASMTAAVKGFALVVIGRAQELCPVSPTDPKHPLYIGTSGALRGSAYPDASAEPEVEEGRISIELGFRASYALPVHERLDANHRYPGAVNPNAQAKFLETAINERADRLRPYVLERMQRDGIGSGGGE